MHNECRAVSIEQACRTAAEINAPRDDVESQLSIVPDMDIRQIAGVIPFRIPDAVLPAGR